MIKVLIGQGTGPRESIPRVQLLARTNSVEAVRRSPVLRVSPRQFVRFRLQNGRAISECGDCTIAPVPPLPGRSHQYHYPFDGCRRNKRNTSKSNRYRPTDGFPLLSVSALLKLADWLQVYRISPHGGKPCDPTKTESFCPAASGAEVGRADATLGSNPGSESRAGVADARPARRSTASRTSKRKGGA